jgi:hypothetical protein
MSKEKGNKKTTLKKQYEKENGASYFLHIT